MHFYKDPEKNILTRILKKTDDIKLLQYIITVFTNLCTNSELLPEIASNELIEIFIKLYDLN